MIILLLSGILLAFYWALRTGRREPNLPDGPPTIPILGNAHLIPRKGAHFVFREMRKIYGGMVSLKIGTHTLIVLSDRQIVREVLDKNSMKSSLRPPSFVAHTITGGDHLLTMNAGPLWRTFRRLLHQEFMESRCNSEHITIQNAEAIQMLHDFMTAPQQHMLHPKRFSNSVIMTILFRIRTPSVNSSHMQRLYTLMEHWSEVMEIGSTPPVDIFPLLKLLPQKLLGGWWSRTTQVRDEMNSLYYDLVEHVRRRRTNCGGGTSFMDKLLDQSKDLGLTDHQIAFLGGVALEGGSDTSSAVITSCIHAMVEWPEVQAKAQAEIDGVMGDSRSPLWSDFSKLPYVTQVVKESQRWRPIGGTGFPHSLSEDQWINGKLLPKGATVVINLWDMHHDEKRYADDDVFNPDRFEGFTQLASEYVGSSDYEKRDHYAYGNGRRICPGMHLGERNIFLGIAKLLWAFKFEKAIDNSGKLIDTDRTYETGYSEGLLINANPFPCRVTVRSKERAATIAREFKQMEEIYRRSDEGL
ncbi:hypothetical protein BDV24DRAFT_154362 [Aspergillus arachidicola]|uniref:Cytochrome P450 n=1 Tax=Aspergillus arachidicola TaxID=656916 RepID=A0A5N6XXQ9_9EURO|nr:hypothetical protein BDV24DRAFT_154362 [Aspergillus arachidicola]